MASGQEAWTGWREHRFRFDLRIDQYPEKAVLHFFPVLISPENELVRVGIEFVVRRVVVVGESDDPRAFRQRDRLSEVVSHLPIEIPLRFENRFRLP